MSMSHVFEKPTIHATFGAISAIKRKTFISLYKLVDFKHKVMVDYDNLG